MKLVLKVYVMEKLMLALISITPNSKMDRGLWHCAHPRSMQAAVSLSAEAIERTLRFTPTRPCVKM